MNIQESNITVSDKIKLEKFEESSAFQEQITEVISSKLNAREIKHEYFDVPEFIVHEDIVIKTEDEEGDHSNSKSIDTDYEKYRNIFMCRYCDLGLSTEEYKNAHEVRCKILGKKLHLGGRALECSFECSYCKFLYAREEDKNKHQVTCKKRKESEKYEESIIKKDARRYCCSKCSHETKWKRDLVHHIRIHDKVNASKHSCNQCPYQTNDKSSLKKHLRMHNCSGLICILCQKSFKRKEHLSSHYLSKHPDRSDQWGSTVTHKIIQCPKCNYKTVYESHFKNHLAKHKTPPDPVQFKCNICGYKCTRKSDFREHLRLHVAQLPFVCTECSKKFNQKCRLDGHIISRHPENEELMSTVTSKVHQCEKCDYKAVQHSNFARHLKTCL